MSLTTGIKLFLIEYSLWLFVEIGTTMGLGNIISQTAMEKRTLGTIDWARVTRFAAFGYFISVDGEMICLKNWFWFS